MGFCMGVSGLDMAHVTRHVLAVLLSGFMYGGLLSLIWAACVGLRFWPMKSLLALFVTCPDPLIHSLMLGSVVYVF